VSPFLTEPLPQGTAQGQQKSLQQQLTDTPVTGSVPKYNLPRGANTGNVGNTTHFGYQTVSSEDKAQKVAEVFHSVASKYDIMNDLMSFGIHRLWKRFAINMSGVRRGQRVLDIAGGTGDLAKVFSREVGPTGHVVLSDINESMLNVGRDRLIDAGCTNVDFVLANAETLEVPVLMAFSGINFSALCAYLLKRAICPAKASKSGPPYKRLIKYSAINRFCFSAKALLWVRCIRCFCQVCTSCKRWKSTES
jgi:hypothetical protein